MRISDWSSDVCSSDLVAVRRHGHAPGLEGPPFAVMHSHPVISDGVAKYRPGERNLRLCQVATAQWSLCSSVFAAGAAAPGFWITASTSRRSPLERRKVSCIVPRLIAVSLTPQDRRSVV